MVFLRLFTGARYVVNTRSLSSSKLRSNQKKNEPIPHLSFKETPQYAKRNEQEKKILDEYYKRVEEGTKTGDVRQPSDIINTFLETQRPVIHQFLHETGVDHTDITFGNVP
ncbi:unnamed protein product [Brachionus calyciflorus]|uniref:Uncharacterized protein n=1 Tax=Brachionus calyciflorus TaxID=104777 RepID=A0A814PTK0_9BILA|nr:unnamed protein product [Brachionus calyciflorus]